MYTVNMQLWPSGTGEEEREGGGGRKPILRLSSPASESGGVYTVVGRALLTDKSPVDAARR